MRQKRQGKTGFVFIVYQRNKIDNRIGKAEKKFWGGGEL